MPVSLERLASLARVAVAGSALVSSVSSAQLFDVSSIRVPHGPLPSLSLPLLPLPLLPLPLPSPFPSLPTLPSSPRAAPSRPFLAFAVSVAHAAPLPRTASWTLPEDEARSYLRTVTDMSYRVPARRSRPITGPPVTVIHTTGEGTCEANIDHLRGVRRKRRIPPLAHALICEDGALYLLAHENRITTGLGRRSSLDGDRDVFRRAYNIEIQGTPWEPLTDAQYATLRALLSVRAAEGLVTDGSIHTHALLAYEPAPGSRVPTTGRKADAPVVLATLGIPLHVTRDATPHPLHARILALDAKGELTQASFNAAYGYLGRIEGSLAWRVPRGSSAYPLLADELRSPSTTYFFPSSGRMVSGAELYPRARSRARKPSSGPGNGDGSEDPFALDDDAIVVFGPRDAQTRKTFLPVLRVALELYRFERQLRGLRPFAFDPYE